MNMNKKVVITVGGTGGHVYPAMALAKQLIKANIDVVFVGGGLKQNRYFDKEQFAFLEVSCGSLSFSKPLTSLRNLGRIVKGIWSSLKFFKKHKPNLVIGFGSYHTFPTLIAAKPARIPIILHEANRIPGRVNRLFSPIVKFTGVHFSDTAKMLKGKAIEIPIPLREGYHLGTVSKQEAKKSYGLDESLPALLVFGGSLGAQSLNTLVTGAVKHLPGTIRKQFQIIHIAGTEAQADSLTKTYAELQIKACVKAFEKRMDIAWQAADLLISRAGAGTIAEATEFEVPGIFIPYPEAMDNHQESHADYMAEVIQGGIKGREKELTCERLAELMETLLIKDTDRRAAMSNAIHAYKNKSQTKDLFSVVSNLLRNEDV